MKKKSRLLLSFLLVLWGSVFVYAEKSATDELPLKRVALFSSGVAYYEHEGLAQPSDAFDFVFSARQVSDVLKSIAVYDSGAKKIMLKYDSSDTLQKTLESLSIDVSGAADIRDMLRSQRGAELIVFTPEEIRGKIIGVTTMSGAAEAQSYLNLKTESGIKMLNLSKIKEFTFVDAKKNVDLERALTLLSASNNQKYKKLRLEVEGAKKRRINIAYVMESAVWKSSYRLNLQKKDAIFQAWAIIDNSTNFDWKNVDLRLVSGKPISFAQNLFSPYFVKRAEIPLSIAGSADVAIYDDSFDEAEEEIAEYEPAPRRMRKMAKEKKRLALDKKNEDVFSANNSSISGERFVFTPAEPITLERQKSMMIPLRVATMPMEKFSVFSNMPYRETVHPKLCIKLKNTSGLKLPAGPITIYDNGYAGDALIEFFPDNAERLIAYGDDMLLHGSNTERSVRSVEKVKINQGSMDIEYSTIYTKNYTIKNSGAENRNIIIEHNKKVNTLLYETTRPSEKTASLYRFKTVAPANKTIDFTVHEKRVSSSIYQLHNFSENQIIQYSSNKNMPESVRETFKTIARERKKLNKTKDALNTLLAMQTQLNSEQERTRKNLEAVRSANSENRFMQKLLEIENNLEALKQDIKHAKAKHKQAQANYHAFIEKIRL